MDANLFGWAEYLTGHRLHFGSLKIDQETNANHGFLTAYAKCYSCLPTWIGLCSTWFC